ncbi:MAG: hypothetical protein DI585_01015 [Pseudomonas fluorescens]|nr:MAG: hypothetical protein DI585_01015 [Pseudomonas fluorescens]
MVFAGTENTKARHDGGLGVGSGLGLSGFGFGQRSVGFDEAHLGQFIVGEADLLTVEDERPVIVAGVSVEVTVINGMHGVLPEETCCGKY